MKNFFSLIFVSRLRPTPDIYDGRQGGGSGGGCVTVGWFENEVELKSEANDEHRTTRNTNQDTTPATDSKKLIKLKLKIQNLNYTLCH